MNFEVVKLDRGLPLLKSLDETNIEIRGEFNAVMSKKRIAITIGDVVEASIPKDQDTAIILNIEKRKSQLTRKDPVDRGVPQVLAANFDSVLICTSADNFNCKHILREVIVAKNTTAALNLLITKTDLVPSFSQKEVSVDSFCDPFNTEEKELITFTLNQFDEIFSSTVIDNEISLDELKNNDDGTYRHETSEFSQLLPESTTTILLGKSGVGKSSLINAIAGEKKALVGKVREKDNKGRHTTVAREIIDLNNLGRVVDMPGIRALGLIDCEQGIERTFQKIEKYAQMCKFRNCTHTNEPSCAVKQNVSRALLDIYHEFKRENG